MTAQTWRYGVGRGDGLQSSPIYEIECAVLTLPGSYAWPPPPPVSQVPRVPVAKERALRRCDHRDFIGRLMGPAYFDRYIAPLVGTALS